MIRRCKSYNNVDGLRVFSGVGRGGPDCRAKVSATNSR